MKKIVLMMLLALGVGLFAHPASQVSLEFERETSILKVGFSHKVSNADKHFIFEVNVYLNTNEIITQKLEKQETADGGELVYRIIEVKPGDKIKVQTNCNKTGKKSAEITIE